jgi:hypothetical protein
MRGTTRMEGERGLARWLEDEAEGDGAWACGYRMEGVWYGGATWSEEGWRLTRSKCGGGGG